MSNWNETIQSAEFKALPERTTPMSKAPAPDAVRLVPVEPTEAMRIAGVSAWSDLDSTPPVSTIYCAMLAAAPAPATARGGDALRIMREGWAADLFDANHTVCEDRWTDRHVTEERRDRYRRAVDRKVEAALASQPQATGGAVEREAIAVREVEMVSHSSGYCEIASSIWRIEISGFCADFETKTAATNFRDAILAILATQPAPSPGGEMSAGERAFTAWAGSSKADATPLMWTWDEMPKSQQQRWHGIAAAVSLPAAPSIQKGGEG